MNLIIPQGIVLILHLSKHVPKIAAWKTISYRGTEIIILFSFSLKVLIFCCVAADAENEESSAELKSAKETIDLKELKRVDHILASLQRKVTGFFYTWYILF